FESARRHREAAGPHAVSVADDRAFDGHDRSDSRRSRRAGGRAGLAAAGNREIGEPVAHQRAQRSGRCADLDRDLFPPVRADSFRGGADGSRDVAEDSAGAGGVNGEVAFLALIGVFLLETVLSLTWNRWYFSMGLPILITRVPRPPNGRLPSAEKLTLALE